MASELGIPWRVVYGIGAMSRAIGLVAHVPEEIKDPMVLDIKAIVDERATSHLVAQD